MISTILVATDGSEASAAAERFGVNLAARLKTRMLVNPTLNAAA